jgi:hypothetical protein
MMLYESMAILLYKLIVLQLCSDWLIFPQPATDRL